MKSLKGFKVLIVDDDPDLRELVCDDFLLAGADVAAASTGKEAIVLVTQNSYDFILSDMRMPNGDGLFLASEVLKLSGPKPLFFLYSGFNDITENDLIKLGIAEVFAKPFAASDMIDSILMKFKDRIAA